MPIIREVNRELSSAKSMFNCLQTFLFTYTVGSVDIINIVCWGEGGIQHRIPYVRLLTISLPTVVIFCEINKDLIKQMNFHQNQNFKNSLNLITVRNAVKHFLHLSTELQQSCSQISFKPCRPHSQKLLCVLNYRNIKNMSIQVPSIVLQSLPSALKSVLHKFGKVGTLFVFQFPEYCII